MIEKVSELKKGDPFRDWLVTHSSNKIKNKDCDVEVFRVYPTAHTVCLYKFKGENFGFVAKFFGEPSREVSNHYNPKKTMLREFNALKHLENKGLCKGQLKAIRPIAMKEDYSHVLLTEYIEGKTLEKYFLKMVRETNKKNKEKFLDKLTMVSKFLKNFHESTKSETLSMDEEFKHMEKILYKIKDRSIISENRFNKMFSLVQRWKKVPHINDFDPCSIHMDATMPHYVMHGEDELTAIDFENIWHDSHPVHDLGVLSAEIKHNVFLRNVDWLNADDFINHLVHEYSQDPEKSEKIKKVLPFFVAHGLSRIIRLDWNPEYRRFLSKEIVRELEKVEALE